MDFSEGKIIFKTGATNTSVNIYSWKNTTAGNDGKVAYIDDFSLSLYEKPTAVSSVVNTVQDAVYSGNLAVSRFDGDALTYTIAVNAAKGTAVVTNPATGEFTYTPNLGGTGTDTFTFKAMQEYLAVMAMEHSSPTKRSAGKKSSSSYPEL